MALTPLDCLALGYFIRSKASVYAIPEGQTLRIAFDLADCSIQPFGMYLLLTEMAKNVLNRESPQVYIILSLEGNQFDKRSLLSLKELLHGKFILGIITLGLGCCFNEDLDFVLKCLIEGLAGNTTCVCINLSGNHFDCSHIYHIILFLVACTGIKTLRLMSYNLNNKVMPLFSYALSLSLILDLDLSYCNISNSSLLTLGRNIYRHQCLCSLFISYNQFTVVGLCKFLAMFKNNAHSKLYMLWCDPYFKEDEQVCHIVHEINACRLLLNGLGHRRTLLSIMSFMDYTYARREMHSLGVINLSQRK